MAQESYNASPEAAYSEPGSLMECAVSKEQLNEKRELRGLNSRLEHYVRNQKEKQSRIQKLQRAVSKQEVEYRQKLKAKEQGFERTVNNLRVKDERNQLQLNELQEELESMTADKQDLAERLATSEAQLTQTATRCDHMSAELSSAKHNLEKMVNQFASMKYKNENHESERANLFNQVTVLKEKNKVLSTELTKASGEVQGQSETFSRLLAEKGEEIEELERKNRVFLAEREDLQESLRVEFDTKLADYVKQREEQYRCEKDEWVRIFKEEFNRKIRAFKETNNDLAHTNAKQEEELMDIRKRIAQLKQQKVELESSARSLEGELEKTRKDLDGLRRAKDLEIKRKTSVIKEMRDRLKQKEIEFDELQSIKGQLALEISMFRQILCDAEKTAGYSPSPGPLRKKRRLDTGEDSCYGTPGLIRAAQFARSVTSSFTPTAARCADDMKESSGFNSREGSVDGQDDSDVDVMGNGDTPGGPPATLQFSSMDLSQSMLELQNTSQHGIQLQGYSITNRDGSSSFGLPDKVLAPLERVRIIVGSFGKAAPGEIIWDADVWCGDEECARLFNPHNREIGRIEIHPDMVPDKAKSRCLVM